MIIRLLVISIFFFACNSCQFEKAIVPAYLEIDDVVMETDYITQGTASHAINSVWVTLENRELGVYELPDRIIVPFTGPQNVMIRYGVSMNGMRSMRDVYPMLETKSKIFDFIPGERYCFNPEIDSLPRAQYRTNARVIIVEDFEGVGISLQRTDKSDADIVKVSHPDSIFRNTQKPEDNLASGKVVLPPGQTLVEIATSNRYVLPKGGNKVFLELNFSGNQAFTVGVFAHLIDRLVQAPVVQVRPTPGEWRKIYIDLTPEISGNPNALDFQIFFGAVKADPSSESTEFLLDNIKVLYLE